MFYFQYMRPTYTVENLLGTRSRVAVLRVLHGVSVPLNASQIAARIGVTHPAVTSALADFASMGIVQQTSAGRATVHWLNRSSVYVESLLDPLFQAERDLPEDLIDDLASAFQGEAISVVLFGSYARGDQTPESDVDVALIAEGGATRIALESAAVDHAIKFRDRFGASLSYLVYTRDEAATLSHTSPDLAESIKRDGIVILGLSPWEWSDDVEE